MLVLTAFEDTDSLGSPSRQVVCPSGSMVSMVPPWVIASRFLAVNREAELKSTNLSLLLLLRVFLSLLFSWPPAI